MDEKASTQPRARNWLEYPCFVFARHPNLRPIPSSEDEETVLEFGREFFHEQVVKMEERIASHEEARQTLDGLSMENRKQLAALVIDSINRFQVRDQYTTEKERRSGLRRQVRSPARKVEKALESLLKNAFEPELDLLGPAVRRHVEDSLEKLNSLRRSLGLNPDRAPAAGSALAAPGPTANDLPPLNTLATVATVQLYWFFRHGCDLMTGHESEVRVALIRNAFWRPWADPVRFRPRYEDTESRGCPAVRQAVRRFRF